MPQRAVWWPDAATLILADLHWGKAETFRLGGVPIPGGVVEHDLARLEAALDATAATRLLVVGDLMHNPRGLTPAMIDRISAWRRARPVHLALVPGNHDARVESVRERWGIEVLPPDHREGPFRFQHVPEPAGSARGATNDGRSSRSASAGLYTWSAHRHPMARLSGRADSLRFPCFHLRPHNAVLPAFSVFTAGFTVRPRPGDRLFAIAEGRVVDL